MKKLCNISSGDKPFGEKSGEMYHGGCGGKGESNFKQGSQRRPIWEGDM